MIRAAGPTLTGQAVRARGTVVPQFLARHALSAPDAIGFTPANAAERKAFAVLLGDGSIRGAEGGYWLDLPRYRLVEAARARRRAGIAVVVAVIGAVAAMLFY